jgi:hypothetical protein
MSRIIAPYRRAERRVLGALVSLAMGACGMTAHAQGRLKAQYTISMAGVSIGQIVWLVDIGDKRYTTSAHGKASGVLSVLVKGEGSVVTHGMIVAGRLSPSYFTSDITDDDGRSELRMTFDDGGVKEVIGQAPPPQSDRLAVTDADRRGVTDPLSAVLIPVKAGDDDLAAENCSHVLSIFDGRRRYDLALSFKRIDKIKIDRGYSGLVLVCGVVLRPIAGYRADSMLVKYVAGRRDMELWFAPIAHTSIVAPIQVVMPTLIGTLKIQADQFEALAPLPAPPGMPPR